MSAMKKLKSQIRARMAITGESYEKAREELYFDEIPNPYWIGDGPDVEDRRYRWEYTFAEAGINGTDFCTGHILVMKPITISGNEFQIGDYVRVSMTRDDWSDDGTFTPIVTLRLPNKFVDIDPTEEPFLSSFNFCGRPQKEFKAKEETPFVVFVNRQGEIQTNGGDILRLATVEENLAADEILGGDIDVPNDLLPRLYIDPKSGATRLRK